MDYFEGELLPALKELLENSSDSIEYALLQTLEDARARFLAFLDLAPQSTKEKQDIESGSLPSSRGITLFNTNVKQAVFSLSTELNASEHYCARLIEHVLPDVTQSVSTSTIHTAVLCHYRERLALLQSLRLVFESAARSDAPQSHVRQFLQRYMYDMVKGPYTTVRNAPTTNLASKLIHEIDAVKADIIKQQARISTADEPTTEWLRTFVQTLQEQRRQLGHLLYLVSAAGQLQPSDVTTLVKWLSKAADGSDSLSVYILVSLFEAISPVDEEGEDSESEIPLVFRDPQLFVAISSTLNAAWPNADLRSAVLLQYSLFHLEVRSRDTHVRGEVSVIEDEVGASLKKAINAGGFQALSRILLRSRDPRFSLERPEFALAADDSVLSGRAVHLEIVDDQALLPPDFRAYLLSAIDNLVIGLIHRLSRTLRDVRKQEEDIVHGSRPPRNFSAQSMSGGAGPSAPEAVSQNNTESLFRLIAIIYDERELDAGLRFWTDDDGGRLFPFLRWAAESRQPGTIVGMLDMIVSLARGQRCAGFAYNFLSTGGGQYTSSADETAYSTSGACSWGTLFMALHHYETRLPAVNNTSATSAPLQYPPAGIASGNPPQSQPRFVLQPNEISMLGAFLRLLRNVARFSPLARLALHENRDFRALQTMFTMASHSIPLELKAMLFDALSAFAAPGGGAVAVDLVHQMWGILEKMEIIPVRGSAPTAMLSGRIGRPVGGAIVELEVVEAGGKTYPATLALVQLLNSLIHTPQKALTLRGGYEADSKTIPSSLGAGYRLPGLKPYVDFVLDKVFVKVFEREYAFADEQWQVMEASLCFIEKSLASFDLSVLISSSFAAGKGGSPSERAKVLAALSGLATHPGFFVMKSILGHPSVRQNVLHVVNSGFPTAFARLNSSYARNKSVLRSFRIMQRVLQIQGLYGEILVPLLNDAGDLPGIGQSGFPLSSLMPLDACILQSPHIVPNIALFITLPDPQIPFFVVQILHGLSDHPNFSWGASLDPMVAAIEGSSDRGKIMTGFVSWLESDAVEGGNELPPAASALDGEASVGNPEAGDVRATILDLLLHNVRSGVTIHNIAHWLLGIHRGPKSDVVVDDPTPSDKSCLHAVLGLIGRGLSGGQHRSSSGAHLSLTHPVLADKCYQLIHRLCTHPLSSGPVIRYLRSREQFFVRQLEALPARIPVIHGQRDGRLTFSDDVSYETTSDAFTSSVRVQTSILQCLALEIRVLHETGQSLRVEALIDGLFGAPELPASDGRMPGQPLTRMLHMLDGFLVQWQELTPLSPVNLQLFGGINWEATLRIDEHGCQVYDSRQLISAVKDARLALQRAGSLSAAGAEQQLRSETNFVLESAVRENHLREISFAMSAGLTAWASLLEVALTNGFVAIRADRREAILHELLLALPQHINSSPPPTASTLSATFLLIVSKLRESTVQQSLLASPSIALGSAQPSERFHVHLKDALECILQQGTTERTRGNLYAASIRHLQTVQEFEDVARDATSFEASTSLQSSQWSSDVLPAADGPSRSSFFTSTVKIVNIVAERIIPIISRDAIDGSEVWKTISFTLLGMLIHLTRHERSQKVLSTMVKGGYLQTIVGSLRETSNDLSRVLQSDSVSLNTLYVYEAKMSLLLRLSEYRAGAERLVESRIFGNLATFEVLGLSPMVGSDQQGSMDDFLPTTAERYNQILTPALQVVVGCLSTVGQSVSTVIRQGLEFLLAHRETFTALLAERPQPSSSSPAIRPIQLLVATAALVFSQTKTNAELFKPIHSAVLSLASRCYSGQQWDRTASSASVEDSPSREAHDLLQQWITTYMVRVIESADKIVPVISMDIVGGGNHAAYSGKTPGFRDVATAMVSEIERLDAGIRQSSEIESRLRDVERIPPDEIEEVLGRAHLAQEASSWSFPQKRAVVSKFLAETLKTRLQGATDALYRVELLLFLITVHLEELFRQDNAAPAPLRLQNSMLRSNPIIQQHSQARESVAGLLLPCLSALDDLDLDMIMGFDAASSRRAFLDLMTKKLRAIITSDGDWEVVM